LVVAHVAGEALAPRPKLDERGYPVDHRDDCWCAAYSEPCAKCRGFEAGWDAALDYYGITIWKRMT
jgi:hypothetical protein